MELKKIIIVDDEIIPRQDLKEIIDWNQYGYEIVGEATNGEQALKLILEYKPDVLVTDIKMPILTGLELIRQLREKGSLIKIIILSCYEEFGFVKEAMRMGVIDYLVKHTFEKEDILRVIRKLDEAFKDESIISGSLELIKKELVQKLFKGMLSPEELNENIKNGIIKFSGNRFVLAVLSGIDTTNVRQIANSLKLKLAGLLDAGNIGFELVDNNYELVMILQFTDIFSENSINKNTIELCRAVISFLKSYPELSPIIGISQTFYKPENIADAYKEASKSFEFKLFSGSGRTIFYKEVSGCINVDTCNLSYDARSHILNLIDKGVFAELKHYINELFIEIQKVPRNTNYLKAFYLELVAIIKQAVEMRSLEIDRFLTGEALSPEYIHKFFSINDMATYFESVFFSLMEEASGRKKYSKKIVHAIDYIKKNHANDISLEQISQNVDLSRIYLSQLFKKEIGINISEYLLEYRIVKAKELLKNHNLKVYEVAERVGFQSSQHFSSIFKKFTGISAQNYKNMT